MQTGIQRFGIVLIAILLLPAFHAWRRRQPVPEPDKTSVEWRVRDQALARAQVFADRRRDPSRVDLTRTTHGAAPFAVDDEVTCQYVPKRTSATSPKFDCRLANGHVIKVKYDTLEIQAETAATRLLSALGFAADQVSIVRRVRCLGCPASPFRTRRAFEHFFASPILDWWLDPERPRDFDWVAVERRIDGRPFEIGEFGGWQFGELALIDEKQGGASRAEVDALRLMAVFLGHWDNKLDNQRLVCLGEPDDESSAAPCARPLLVVHDLGSSFGSRRVNLANWIAERIWAHEPSCLVSMDRMHYGRGTFVPVHISEEGRLRLGGALQRLSEGQIRDLFAAARFPDPQSGATPGADPTPWVRAFQDKVRQIIDRPPCAPAL